MEEVFSLTGKLDDPKASCGISGRVGEHRKQCYKKYEDDITTKMIPVTAVEIWKAIRWPKRVLTFYFHIMSCGIPKLGHTAPALRGIMLYSLYFAEHAKEQSAWE
eukprot:850666-Ditylum_brightwellii.AAC.1